LKVSACREHLISELLGYRRMPAVAKFREIPQEHLLQREGRAQYTHLRGLVSRVVRLRLEQRQALFDIEGFRPQAVKVEVPVTLNLFQQNVHEDVLTEEIKACAPVCKEYLEEVASERCRAVATRIEDRAVESCAKEKDDLSHCAES